MHRFVVAFALAASLFVSFVGCGTHESPETSAADLEAHRQEMEAISARERGG